MFNIYRVVSVSMLLFVGTAFSQCKVSDFEVLDFDYQVIDLCKSSPCPTYKIVGELKNNCNNPGGAEIRITGRDKNNKIVDTRSLWPASTRNIEPGDTEPFNFGPLFNFNPAIKKFDVKIINGRKW